MKRFLYLLIFSVLALLSIPAAAQRSYEQFFTAVVRDDVGTVRRLHERGFDLNSPDPELTPPLVLALQRDALAVARYLALQPEVNIEAVNAAGESALMMAALRDHLPLVEQLLARRAQVNRPGWTPLHYAATNKGEQALAITRLLLEHSSYIDAESPNGTTPLMMAARYGREEVVRLLLEEGADPTLRNRLGLDAIDFARQVSRQTVIDMIAAAIRTRQPRGQW